MESDQGVPLIEIADLRKHYGGLRPLRLNGLIVAPGERVTLGGLDAAAAEMLVLVVTGASLPDQGIVRIRGRDTRQIETDTEWLTSLDVFGMVTVRAVLLDSLATEANLAVPLTLSIDPIPPDVRTAVEALALEVGLDVTTLPARVGELSEASRMRVHLARALALGPQVLLLEHPTARLEPEDAEAFGRQLAAVAERRKIGWLALTADAAFAKAAGGRQCRLDAASGQVRDEGGRRWGWFR